MIPEESTSIEKPYWRSINSFSLSTTTAEVQIKSFVRLIDPELSRELTSSMVLEDVLFNQDSL
ncbi:hypothetical protein J6590_024270 [Homalodisca vitripennis]|nr:hypothetical protein J6590_024270 [Homalodisca vitripennis]